MSLDNSSPWLLRWSRQLAPGARVLDLACGSGRHLRPLAAQGFRLTGVDRDAQALAPLAGLAETLVADLEAGPWPLGERQFDLVLVTNYLWRPLLPQIVAAVPELPVMMDSGVRRGTDVLKALALGACFVFVGRPFLYAAAVAGQAGVRHGIDLLQQEIHRNMALLGAQSLADLRDGRVVPLR